MVVDSPQRKAFAAKAARTRNGQRDSGSMDKIGLAAKWLCLCVCLLLPLKGTADRSDPKALTTLLVRIVSGTDSVAAKAVLQHFGEAMPKQARELWEPVNGGGAVWGGSYHEEDAAGSAQNLYTAMGGEVRRESEMASKMGQLLAGEDAKDMRQVFAAAITGDEAIFGSPVLRSAEGGATTPFDGDIMAMLKNDGNRQMLAGFLGQWDPAAAWVADNVSQEQQMNIICQQEPALVQASLITDGGEAGLDALSAGLAAEGSITIGGYAGGLDGAGIHTRPGMANDPGDIGTGEVASTMGLVSEELTLGEHHIYGAQRLGIRYYDGNTGADGTVAHSTGVTNEGTGLRNVWVYGDAAHSYYNLNNKQAWYSYGYGDMVKATVAAYTNGWNGWADPVNGAHVNGWEPTALVNGYMAGRALGWTHYEITDHLGDVLATILDRKTGAATSHSANYNYGYEAITGVGNTGVLTLNTYAQTGVAAYDYFRADVVTANDVYPGGMPMAERTYAFVGGVGMGVAGYRYGNQGQPKDDEVYGIGMMSVFKYRMEDVRLNRFWTVDPLTAKYPYYSPFAFSGNRLTDSRELEGLEPVPGALQNYVLRDIGAYGNDDQSARQWANDVAIPAAKQVAWEVGKFVVAYAVSEGLGVLDGVLAREATVATEATTAEPAVARAAAPAEAPATGAQSGRPVLEQPSAQRVASQRNQPQQEGIPNSSQIQQRGPNGEVTKYSTYDENGNLLKEYRGTGKDHGNIPRPNIKVPKFNTNPKTGKQFQNGYDVRPAKPWEKPKESE